MIEKQLLRSIVHASKEKLSEDCIIVSKTILNDVLQSLNNEQTIKLLLNYGLYLPKSEHEFDGEWAKEIREILNISQVELAKLAKVNQCDISYLENGNNLRISGTQHRRKKIRNKLEELIWKKIQDAA